MDIANSILKLQSTKSWSALRKEQPAFELPVEIQDRYKTFPRDWVLFISNYLSVVNSTETTWFLCSNDYALQDEDSFCWNEWELISLQAAIDNNDVAWQDSICKFWDKHLPILLSVADGYEYYAIRIFDGVIVKGCEPEFEDCSEVANNFGDLLEKIMSNEIYLA